MAKSSKPLTASKLRSVGAAEHGLQIRQAVLADAAYYVDHLMRHFDESGNGDPIFHPVDDFNQWSEGSFYERFASRWQSPIHELGWERVWILHDAESILGHVDLRSTNLKASSHRCELGIGIERSARRKGFGRKLMQTAIEWVVEQGEFSWIDLAVFTHNPPAIALYESMGFKQVGTFEDYFRVGQTSIDDIQMTLDLRSHARKDKS